MTTLREWLDRTDTSVMEFAARIGVNQVTVYKWMSGRVKPSFGKLCALEELTGGEVTAGTMIGGSAHSLPSPQSAEAA